MFLAQKAKCKMSVSGNAVNLIRGQTTSNKKLFICCMNLSHRKSQSCFPKLDAFSLLSIPTQLSAPHITAQMAINIISINKCSRYPIYSWVLNTTKIVNNCYFWFQLHNTAARSPVCLTSLAYYQLNIIFVQLYLNKKRYFYRS